MAISIPNWLTNDFTIHVILNMVDRAVERIKRNYPPQGITPELISDDKRDLQLRTEAYQVLKVYLDSAVMEDTEKKNDTAYQEWSSKVRLAEGLYSLILEEIKHIMTQSVHRSDSIIKAGLVTHLWTVKCRDEINNTNAFSIEYPDDNPSLHPVYKVIKLRLEQEEKYTQYLQAYSKLRDFTNTLFTSCQEKGSIVTLSDYNTKYKLGL